MHIPKTFLIILILLLVAEVYLADATEPGVRLMQETQSMLDGMPTLISIGEAARDIDGNAVVVYTWVGGRQKVVAPMPADGIYPQSVFRYRVRQNDRWQWFHEIVYSDDSVRRMEVSK